MEKSSYDIIREYRMLREDIFYPFDDRKENEFDFQKENISKKRKRWLEIKEQVQAIPPEKIQECKTNLLRSIDKILELISGHKLGYPLSRNQGLVVPNFVYGKVIGVLKNAINSVNGYGWSPFYFEQDGDFDSRDLIQLLREFKSRLNEFDFSTFFDLEDLFEEYIEKLLELWREEDKAQAQPEY